MYRITSFSFVFILVSIFAVPGCSESDNAKAPDEVTLRFNLQKGKSYTYKMDVESEQAIQNNTMESDMSFVYEVEVIGDSNNVKTLKTTYERIRMEMTGAKTPTGESRDFRIDTDQPNKDTVSSVDKPLSMLNNMFYAIKGKSFLMKVDAEGHVVEVSGLSEMQEAMLGALQVEPSIRETFRNAFASQFNERTLKKAFDQAFNIFPNKPVRVGDTWEKQVNLAGSISMTIVYTVKEISDKKAVLDVHSNIKSGGSTGTQTGTMQVDLASGLVTSATIEQKMEGAALLVSKTTIEGKEN